MKKAPANAEPSSASSTTDSSSAVNPSRVAVPYVLGMLLDAGGDSAWSPIRKALTRLGVESPASARETMAALDLISVREGATPPGEGNKPALFIRLTPLGEKLARRAKREAA